MVKGLDLFRSHFKDYSDQYVLIGGTACDLVMAEASLPFRATKDLDIVLIIEMLQPSFAKRFWRFVSDGRYASQETSDGKRQFYRFRKPENKDYPDTIELFSRLPDALDAPAGNRLTKISMSDATSSISAILLEDNYYHFLRSGKREVQGLPVVGSEHLIPLKAKAWLDLTNRKLAGEPVDSDSIKKHKNDVFRLLQLVSPAYLPVPDVLRRDMALFVTSVGSEGIDLKNLGTKNLSQEEALNFLLQIYVNSEG